MELVGEHGESPRVPRVVVVDQSLDVGLIDEDASLALNVLRTRVELRGLGDKSVEQVLRRHRAMTLGARGSVREPIPANGGFPRHVRITAWFTRSSQAVPMSDHACIGSVRTARSAAGG